MKLAEALNRGRSVLAQNAITDAPLEAELLLRHILKINRAQFYIKLESELSPQDEKVFEELIERRLNDEPTAYIVGHREFYGREFQVNQNTLIPRPESELLVETALGLAQDRQLHTIADIGTGCGAIAVSLALELPGTRIYATDLSAPALEVTSINCQRHGVTDRVHLLHGDMLEPLPEPVDLLIANLPYVRYSELTPTFEPTIALDGGAEGTEMIVKLCRQAKDKLAEGGSMLLEIGQGQSQKILSLLHQLFPSDAIEATKDLSCIERVVSLSLTSEKVAK